MLISQLANNQFVINTDTLSAFQSYETLVAVKKDNQLYVSDAWCYSRTTLKYFKKFANMESSSKKEIQNLIDSKYIILISDAELIRFLEPHAVVLK